MNMLSKAKGKGRITAKIIRKDGTVEDCGVLSSSHLIDRIRIYMRQFWRNLWRRY
jgi:hypothetical protein